jgi:hypothetical protein
MSSQNTGLFSNLTGTGNNTSNNNNNNTGSSIDKKKEQKNQGATTQKQTGAQWSKFAKSIGLGALHLLIYMYIASSVVYSIRNLGTTEFFPDNPNAPPYVSGATIVNGKRVVKNVGFPYGFYDKNEPSSILNYVINIIKHSWVTERKVTKSVLNVLNEGFTMLDHYDFGTMDPKNVERIKKIGYKIISYIYIILGPYIILPGLVLLSGITGYISMVIAFVTKAPDLITKLIALMTILLFILFISPIVSSMNFIQGFYTFVILAFMPLLKDYKHLFKFFGEYSGFISFLFILMIISSSNSYLPREVTIGLMVGVLFLFGGPILHFLFASSSSSSSSSSSLSSSSFLSSSSSSKT